MPSHQKSQRKGVFLAGEQLALEERIFQQEL